MDRWGKSKASSSERRDINGEQTKKAVNELDEQRKENIGKIKNEVGIESGNGSFEYGSGEWSRRG